MVTTRPNGYHWLHIPSGKVGIGEFTEEHALIMGTTLQPNGGLSLEAAYTLINRWNSGAPDWKYWL